MPNRRISSGIIAGVLAVALACGWALYRLNPSPPATLHPIVAELVANPDAFVGTRIGIYGLVVQSDAASRSFMLQDVSQRPLRIDARELPPVSEGNQVEVEGVLRRMPEGLVLVGETVRHERVLAGGGCC